MFNDSDIMAVAEIWDNNICTWIPRICNIMACCAVCLIAFGLFCLHTFGGQVASKAPTPIAFGSAIFRARLGVSKGFSRPKRGVGHKDMRSPSTGHERGLALGNTGGHPGFLVYFPRVSAGLMGFLLGAEKYGK